MKLQQTVMTTLGLSFSPFVGRFLNARCPPDFPHDPGAPTLPTIE